MPPMVRIKAVATGMRILSLNLGVEKSSIDVAAMDAINKNIIDTDERRNIIKYVLIRKAKVPSSDLLNNRVLPNLIPIIAAAESDTLITKIAIIATFSLNRHTDMHEPINTQDAPDNILYS